MIVRVMTMWPLEVGVKIYGNTLDLLDDKDMEHLIKLIRMINSGSVTDEIVLHVE